MLEHTGNCGCLFCKAGSVFPYQNEFPSGGETSLRPSTLDNDLAIIEAALHTMMVETNFEALGRLALEALMRVRSKS